MMDLRDIYNSLILRPAYSLSYSLYSPHEYMGPPSPLETLAVFVAKKRTNKKSRPYTPKKESRPPSNSNHPRRTKMPKSIEELIKKFKKK